MKKSRITISIVLIAAFLLTACSAQSTDQNSTAQSVVESTEPSDTNIIYGNVTAIDGSTITLALGTLNQDTAPSGDGQTEAQPSENRQNDGGQPPMPSGQPADMPSGQPADMPSGDGQPSMLTLTGETIAITVTNENVITTPEFNANQPDSQVGQQTSQPSAQKTGLAAIQAGSVLKIVYASDNETIQSITVINGFGGGFPGGSNRGNANSAPSASAS